MQANRDIRILITEGSSLSSRQTITALGLYGYTIDMCDSTPLCISHFSKFIRRYFQCPKKGTDPEKYVTYIIDLLKKGDFDVLLPIHEESYLFAKYADRIPCNVSYALSSLASFTQLQSKVEFFKLLTMLGLPQPATQIISKLSQISEIHTFPCYIKKAIGTAGQGVFKINGKEDIDNFLENNKDIQTPLLVQEMKDGLLCQAQAVFDNGKLIALHMTKTRGISIGGGHAARESISHPHIKDHLKKLGEYLQWHGPLAIDYIFDEHKQKPYYIDPNPRLVEPMNAFYSGINIPDKVVQLALRKTQQEDITQQIGIRSHSLLALLLGTAAYNQTRKSVIKAIFQSVLKREIFKNSKEDLTPITQDFFSIIPLCVVSIQLLLNPKNAIKLARKTVDNYSLQSS